MRRTPTSLLSRRPCLMALALLSALAAPRPAAAQEINLTGPLRDCTPSLHDTATVAVEPSWWLAGGGGVRLADGASDWRGIFGVGAEVTAELERLGSLSMYGGPVELRWGPWTSLVTGLDGVRVEGGLLLSVGQVQHAQWGTYALRFGGGFGDDGLGLAPHAVATVTGGVRYVKARYLRHDPCDSAATQRSDRFASGMRLFESTRLTLDNERVWQITFGVELEPTFFFPPYSLEKWIGTGH